MGVIITPTMVGQVVISGLLAGALYSMVALGLALIYGVMRVINIAHGTILMLGAYTTFWWFHLLGVNPYLSLLASMPLMFLLGVLLQWMLVTRVVDAPELSSLLLTFGISIALVNVAPLSFTSDLRSVEFLTGAFLVGPIALSKSRLISLAFAVVTTLRAPRGSWEGPRNEVGVPRVARGWAPPARPLPDGGPRLRDPVHAPALHV